VVANVGISWIYLIVAGLMETGWAVGLKYTEGFSKLFPSVVTVVCMIGSFYFLSKSLTELPLGTAYAFWTGIGIIGTVVMGIVLFGESKDMPRILSILLILGGIIGLRIATPG
jgi:quaternary ammonium compound-resistance protein SugE